MPLIKEIFCDPAIHLALVSSFWGGIDAALFIKTKRDFHMLVLKTLTIGALIGSVAWFIHSPDYEPAVASITALSASIAAFFVERRQKQGISMHQEVAGQAVGIQAGGDVSTGNLSVTAREK